MRDQVVALTGQLKAVTAERDTLKNRVVVAEEQVVEKDKEVGALVAEKGRLQGALESSTQKVKDKDEVIEGQRMKIEQLIAQNTENISNIDLVRVIIRRFFSRK